jgi:hypothetical protein
VRADTTGVPRVRLTYVAVRTTTTVKAARHRHRLSVSGTLKPAVGGVSMRIELMRKTHGKYRKVTSAKAVVTRSGHYSTSLHRAKAGKCEVTVNFAGYGGLRPSTAKRKLAC